MSERVIVRLSNMITQLARAPEPKPVELMQKLQKLSGRITELNGDIVWLDRNAIDRIWIALDAVDEFCLQPIPTGARTAIFDEKQAIEASLARAERRLNCQVA